MAGNRESEVVTLGKAKWYAIDDVEVAISPQPPGGL